MSLEFEKIIIDNINSINWEDYAGPDYYKGKEVVSSITNLVKLNNEKENGKIYNEVLFAIGNNHAGTYYPAILKALPLIIQIAEKSVNEISRNCALEIMSDLFYSFQPELGSFNKTTEDELKSFVKNTIRHFVEQHNKLDSDRNVQLILHFEDFINEEASS